MSHINLGHSGELIRQRNRKEPKAVGKNGACARQSLHSSKRQRTVLLS